MLLKFFKNYKNNIFINKIYKILRTILPIIILIILFKNSYISLEPIKLLFYVGNINIIFQITFLSLFLSILLYFRWIFCLNIYNIKVNLLRLIQVNSEAYTIASLIPGQIGIDLLRIGKLRKSDSSKFKTKLLQATLIEKIFALFGQIFILVFFLTKNIFHKSIFVLSFFSIIYLFLYSLKIINKKKLIKEYISNINLDKMYIILFYSIFCNFISCYLIYVIAHGFDMNYSFSVMSISSSLSNISAVIPITPNGIGLSELIFSKVTQIISDINVSQSVATIYFSFRILNLLSNTFIYYISNYLNFKNFKINV